MKFTLSLSAILFSTLLFSQIIINPGTKTSVTNSSVSLEFGPEPRGIILPYVEATKASDATAGTFIMDPTDKVVKLKHTDGTWQNFTGEAKTTNDVTNAPFSSSLAKGQKGKAIIGSPALPQAQVAGILILSDSDKAMILPKVDSPHLNIKNPAAGMMVYDSANKILATFNGTQWSFWRP